MKLLSKDELKHMDEHERAAYFNRRRIFIMHLMLAVQVVICGVLLYIFVFRI